MCTFLVFCSECVTVWCLAGGGGGLILLGVWGGGSLALLDVWVQQLCLCVCTVCSKWSVLPSCYAGKSVGDPEGLWPLHSR